MLCFQSFSTFLQLLFKTKTQKTGKKLKTHVFKTRSQKILLCQKITKHIFEYRKQFFIFKNNSQIGSKVYRNENIK